MNQSLSPQQLQTLFTKVSCGRSVRVVDYSQIIKCADLQAFFSPSRPAIIIFYPQFSAAGTTHGHYCALIKNQGAKTFYFYDPLAYKPDGFKRFAHQRNRLYPEQQNSLIASFLASGYSIDYNHYQHQSRASQVATCGRHCILRCLAHSMSTEQYHRFLNSFPRHRRSRFKDGLVVELIN